MVQQLSRHAKHHRKCAERTAEEVLAFLKQHCLPSDPDSDSSVSVKDLWQHYQHTMGHRLHKDFFVGALWMCQRELPMAMVPGPWRVEGLQVKQPALCMCDRELVRAFLEQHCPRAQLMVRLKDLLEDFLQHSGSKMSLMHFLRALWQLELEMPQLQVQWLPVEDEQQQAMASMTLNLKGLGLQADGA